MMFSMSTDSPLFSFKNCSIFKVNSLCQMRAVRSASNRNRNVITNPLIHCSPYHHTLCRHPFSASTLPGYEKPLPLDVRTGKLRRTFTEKERIGLGKRNRKFRKYLTNQRRHMDRELLFGYAATRMMNKLAKGANQKRLQKELVNHLYALKLNSMRLPFMDIEGAPAEDKQRKPIRLTRRLKAGSSWNMRQKRKKGLSWEVGSRPTKNPKA